MQDVLGRGYIYYFLIFLIFLCVSSPEASIYTNWTVYDYHPAVSLILKTLAGDLDGDGASEIITISAGDEEIESTTLRFKEVLGTISVYPNPYDPTLGDTYVTFTNLPDEAMIVVWNEFGLKVFERYTYLTQTITWDVKDMWGKPLPSGRYKWRVYNLKNPKEFWEGELIVKNVRGFGGFIIRAMKFDMQGEGRLLGKLKLNFEGSFPLLINSKIADIDNDKKDEIIFLLHVKESYIEDWWYDSSRGVYYPIWKDRMHSYVYVVGYDGGEIVCRYKTEDLSKFGGICLDMTICDLDRNDNKEILVGYIKPNLLNFATTQKNIELLNYYIENKKYIAAANILYRGLIKGSLFESGILRIEFKGGSFTGLIVHSGGDGIIYRINSNHNKVILDVFDLHYDNINKAIYNIAWAIVQNIIKAKVKKTKVLEEFQGIPQIMSIINKAINKAIKNNLLCNVFPQSMAKTEVLLHLFKDALSSKVKKSYIEKAKKQDNKYYYYEWWRPPSYGDLVERELISLQERLIFKEGTPLPYIPYPLLISRLRLLHWKDNGFNIIKDSKPLDLFSLNTKMLQDGSIVTKSLIINQSNMKAFIDSLLRRLVQVEIKERDRFINIYTGELQVNINYFIFFQEIPYIPGSFFQGKLYKFDRDLNNVWESQVFDNFLNTSLEVCDINLDNQDEAIIASFSLDYTKLNELIKDINTQWHKFKEYVQAGKKDIFLPQPPNIPEGLFDGSIRVHSLKDGGILAQENIPHYIRKMDKIITDKEELVVGFVKLDLQRMNDFIDKVKELTLECLNEREVWYETEFNDFMKDLSPKIEEYNNWAREWYRNGKQRDWYSHPKYGWGRWPTNPVPPDISWPKMPSMPAKKEYILSIDQIKNLFQAQINVYSGSASVAGSLYLVPTWESQTLDGIINDLILANIDSVNTQEEISASVVKFSPYVFEGSPRTVLHIFKSTAISGKGNNYRGSD